jgi:ketosteroid isomerase-like protein
MTTLEELATRIERLEARDAINELASSYAIACDEHDIPRLSSLFTEDAVFDSPSGVMKAKGREAIIAMFVGLFKIRGPGYHWTHDKFVRINENDP